MIKRYLTLLGRIENETEEINKVVERVGKAWERFQNDNDNIFLDSVALNLHDYYSGLERIFEMIANEVDGSLPEGSAWHKELLKQMTIKIKKVRPAVITKDTENRLDDYRGFRHIVRNVYSYKFSPEKISILVGQLTELNSQVVKELKGFNDFLEEAANS